MDYKLIKKVLENANEKYPIIKIENYLNYLKKLENEKNKEGNLKNKWFSYKSEENYIDYFKKVADLKLFLDGETVFIQQRGVDFSYHAYKNLVLQKYPDTKFEIEIVTEGDNFSFVRENNKIIAKHEFSNNIFKKDRKILGVYTIIRNKKRGEHLEVINLQELQTIKSKAKTQYVWDEWFNEMAKKSVLKRACKRYYYDIVNNLDTLDNENYNLDNITDSKENLNLKNKVENIKNIENLKTYYAENIKKIKDTKNFNQLVMAKKKELENNNMRGYHENL